MVSIFQVSHKLSLESSLVQVFCVDYFYKLCDDKPIFQLFGFFLRKIALFPPIWFLICMLCFVMATKAPDAHRNKILFDVEYTDNIVCSSETFAEAQSLSSLLWDKVGYFVNVIVNSVPFYSKISFSLLLTFLFHKFVRIGNLTVLFLFPIVCEMSFGDFPSVYISRNQ